MVELFWWVFIIIIIFYKNSKKTSVGIAIHTQESNIDLAESQTLFKNGMFYGFTIMVILLNLVCFFLFDEKIFLLYSLALTSVLFMTVTHMETFDRLMDLVRQFI